MISMTRSTDEMKKQIHISDDEKRERRPCGQTLFQTYFLKVFFFSRQGTNVKFVDNLINKWLMKKRKKEEK